MPTFKMRDVGKIGVITDVPAYDLPPAAWSDARNVRFDGYKIEKFGGSERVLERIAKDGETTLSITEHRDNHTDVSWIMATDRNIYRIDSLTRHSIISKIENAYNAQMDQRWTYCHLSNCLVLNNLFDAPQGLRPGQAKFEDLPEWGMVTGPTGEKVKEEWRAYSMRSYKNFLVALNTLEEGREYPQRVRWSDIADVNDLPLDWDHSSTTNSAGFNDLTDATGEIIDGLYMRDNFIIYTSDDTFLMQYIGGNAIFRFTKLFTGSGLLAPQCVCEFDGRHFVIAHNDIYVHDGSTRTSVVAGRVRDFLMKEITSVNPKATKVFSLYPKKEIWITYCRPGTDRRNQGHWVPNKAAVWNWEVNTWTFYDIPELTDINLVYPLSIDERKWEDYGPELDDPPEGPPRNSWEGQSDTARWELTAQNFRAQAYLALGRFGTLFQVDVGENFSSDDFKPGYSLPSGGSIIPITPDVYYPVKRPLVAWMERKQIDMDEMELPTWANIKIRKAYPQFFGTGGVWIELGGSNDPQSDPVYKQRQHFEIGKDYQTSFRVDNKYIAIKFTDDQLGSWKFTGYDFDMAAGGVR